MSVGLLFLSALMLLPSIGGALFLGQRYASRSHELSPLRRVLYAIGIAICLAPIGWPYLERLAAYGRCVALRQQDQAGHWPSATIRIDRRHDRYGPTASYLEMDTFASSEWLLRNGIRWIAYEQLTREFAPPGREGRCDAVAGWESFTGACSRIVRQPDAREGLHVIFGTTAAADKKGSDTVVTFLDAATGRTVAVFHSFQWFPSFGSFVLGSGQPFTCGDRREFAKFFQAVLGN